MKAIGYTRAAPVGADETLVEFETDRPEPGPRDLLVEVRAVSVNPVDCKVRANFAPGDRPRILGFDAAGIVVAVGSEVELFKVGDAVYYAGDISRPGSNAQFQCVDERIAGSKPERLSFSEAAAVPLTAITAWEMLFDCFGLAERAGDGEALLVIGGAGGVGSMLIQLAKALTGLTVIATASRPETKEWVRKMGADLVVDHAKPLDEELAALGIRPRYVACLTHTQAHFAAVLELIAVRGQIGVIDDPPTLDIKPAKQKSLSVSWEYMFARAMNETADIIAQHQLLSRVSTLLDDGRLQSTLTNDAGVLNAASLEAAHRQQQTGSAIGKTVLQVGWR